MADELEMLISRIGLPARLSTIGVSAEVVPRVVAGALADHSHATNPKALTAEDYRGILEAVL